MIVYNARFLLAVPTMAFLTAASRLNWPASVTMGAAAWYGCLGAAWTRSLVDSGAICSG